MSDPLKIPIITTADTSGAKAAASALGDVNRAAGKGASTAKELDDANRQGAEAAGDAKKGFLEQGEAAEQAASGARILSSALNGNVAEITKIGPLIKSLRATLTTVAGVWGLVATAAGAAIIKIAEHLKAKRENQLREEAEKTEIAFNAARDSAARLNEQKTEALQAQLKAIDDTARMAVERIQRLVDIAAKLDDVEKATQLAAIDADQSLTAEQKLNAKADVNRTFSTRAESRTRQVEDVQLAAAQQKSDAAVAASAAASREAGRAREKADATSGKTLVDLMKPLEAQLAQAQAANPGADVQIPELNNLRTRLAATQSPEGKIRNEIAQAEANARAADLKAAKDRELAAQQARRELETRIADERTGREQLAAAQAKQAKRQYNLELLDARALDEAKPRRAAPAPEPLNDFRVTTNADAGTAPAMSPAERETQAARDRIGALGNVGAGLAQGVLSDPSAGEGLKELAKQTAAAQQAVQSDQSAAIVTKAVDLMQGLSQALALSNEERAKTLAEQARRMSAMETRIATLASQAANRSDR